MSRSFFTGSEAELASGAQNFSTRASATPSAYNLTQQEADGYAEVNGRWQTAWAACRDPRSRTQILISQKNAVRDEIRQLSSKLAKVVDGGAHVSDSQRLELGLSVRKAPSPIPAPSESPSVDVVSVKGRTVNVHIHDSATKTKRGKPAGALAALVFTFVGETYPVDDAAWRYEGSTTKSDYPITFANDVAGGQQVWIRAAWVNRRQERGPLSVPIAATIQGGGSAVQTQEMKIAA